MEQTSNNHRNKPRVAVPLGGFAASNQLFARSLRSSDLTTEQKEEFHASLIAEDAKQDRLRGSVSPWMSGTELRRKELLQLRQKIRSGEDTSNDIAVLDDGSTMQVSEVINLYRKNQAALVKSNKKVMKKLDILGKEFKREAKRSPHGRGTAILDLDALRELQTAQLQVHGGYIRTNASESSTALVPASPERSIPRLNLDSPNLRAHERQRQVQEASGYFDSDTCSMDTETNTQSVAVTLSPPRIPRRGRQGSSRQVPARSQSPSKEKLDEATRTNIISKPKTWMPPSPGRYQRKESTGFEDSHTARQLAVIKKQQKHQNHLLRMLSDNQSHSNPDTLEMLALAERNAELATRFEECLAEKTAIQMDLNMERVNCQNNDQRFAEMVDICKEEERKRIEMEEKNRGLIDELRNLEKANIRNLGNSQREGQNAAVYERKANELSQENERLKKEIERSKSNAVDISKKYEYSTTELQELREQLLKTNQENERLLEKQEYSMRLADEKAQMVRDLETQLSRAEGEMRRLTLLQESINRAKSGQDLSMNTIRNFEKQQHHIEELAKRQYAELQQANETINRLESALHKEKQMAAEVNSVTSEARASLIQMEQQIGSDANVIALLQGKIAELEKLLVNKDTEMQELRQQLADSKRRSSKAQNAVSSINQANMALREEMTAMERRLRQLNQERMLDAKFSMGNILAHEATSRT
jgi:hypothetical protein